MKTLILMVLSLTLLNFTPEKHRIKEPVATCYGYSSCSACSNCSRCKHCGAGGSCGVCSTKTTKSSKTFSSSQKANNNMAANYVGQCKAFTKKGSRCKRSGNSSGYCWQHKK